MNTKEIISGLHRADNTLNYYLTQENDESRQAIAAAISSLSSEGREGLSEEVIRQVIKIVFMESQKGTGGYSKEVENHFLNIVKQSLPSPVKQEAGKGMRFIKCSDRLPVKKKKDLVVRYVNGVVLSILFIPKKTNMENIVEWLDESSEVKEEGERKFTKTEICHLQSEVHKITGNGEVMALFNKLLGVNAG